MTTAQAIPSTTQSLTTQKTPPSAQPIPQFQAVTSNEDLARTLGWKSQKGLTMLGRNKSEHYSVLFLKKKGASGKSAKKRILHNPDTLMRSVQYRILTRLLDKVEVPEYIYAFERGKSVPAMAQLHVGNALVISVDLKDFFPSIKQNTVQALFQQYGMAETAARTLSELCTYGPFVPQGALTSPKLSNLISAATFGPLLKAYCEERGYNLSIYADDITISTARDLAAEEGRESVTALIQFVKETVELYGFRINHRKTKVMRKSQRQYVCGAVVNSRVNLQRRQRDRLRAMVHNVLKNGIEAEAAKSGATPDKFMSNLMGHVNWFHQLNEDVGGQLKAQLKCIAEQAAEQPGNAVPVLASCSQQVPDEQKHAAEVDADKAPVPW